MGAILVRPTRLLPAIATGISMAFAQLPTTKSLPSRRLPTSTASRALRWLTERPRPADRT